MENPRAYEQLVKRVEELEKQLKERPDKEEMMRDLRKDLLNYNDKMRSEGDITLKKNFIIRNRKGEIPGSENDNDNTLSMYFNDVKMGRINHIFLGDNSVKGDFRNNALLGRVVHREDAPNILNNGGIQFQLIRDEDLDNRAKIKNEDSLIPQITLHASEAYGLSKGEAVVLWGTGVGGAVQLGQIYGGSYRAIAINNDGIFIYNIPTSDPGVAGQIWRDSNKFLKISTG